MKKKLLLATLCLMATVCGNALTLTHIDFQVSITENLPLSPGGKKSPMNPPTVSIEDYTLFFDTAHPDYVLHIKDEEGNLVFTTMVYSAQTQVVLPSTLSGDYQIELVMGNWLFIGWISLNF